MGKSSKITIGHNYFMGLHMGICRGPIDEIVEIKAGGKTIWKYNPAASPRPTEAQFEALSEWRRNGFAGIVAPTGSALVAYNYVEQDKIEWNEQITANRTITIKAKNIFGGEESEGGIEGDCDVMMGASDQPVNERLASMLGGLVSAFRGRATLFFDGLVCSMSKYPKAWEFRQRRALNGWDGGTWYAEKCVIWLDDNKIRAMNGAHIQFEALTNRDWGRGFPRAKLDESSFIAAADKLYAENFGLCYRWARQDDIGNFIRDINIHIGANLFLHPVTGLWTLRLVRDDYDVNDLPLFDADSGLLGIDEDDNASIASAANEIVVNYIRPEDGDEGSVRVQNLAGIRASGGIISETVDYPGLPTPELALRIAQRDLRAKFGLKKFKIRLDRRGYQIEPGGVFRISAPERGIDNLVLRAGEIDDGQISSGIITVTAVMDVFGLPSNSFIKPQPPLWTPPNIYPEPIENYIIGEATYRDLAASLDVARLENLTPGTNLVTSVAGKPTGLSIDYDLQTRVGTNNWLATSAEFAPTAELTAVMVKTNDRVTVTLTNMQSISEVQPGTTAVIDGEIFRVDAIDESDGFCMLARGCIDTVPAEHAAGSLVYFYQDAIGVDPTEYGVGVTVQTRLISKTGAGQLNVDDAPVVNYEITQRRERPYPPGKVLFNGEAYPEWVHGLLTLGWAHRDRVLQADQLIDQSIGSVGPEFGVSYSLVVKGEGDVTIVDQSVTDTSYSISREMEYLSGATDYANNRILRLIGLGTVGGDLGTNVILKSGMVNGGWIRVSPIGTVALNTASRFIDGTTGAQTLREFSPSWSTATTTANFNLNSTVYQSVVSYDSFVGWAVKINKTDFAGDTAPLSEITSADSALVNPIRDRRLTANSQLMLVGHSGSLWYWATTYAASRGIFRSQQVLHNVLKSAIVTGPLTSTRTVMHDYYSADMAQFNDPSIYAAGVAQSIPGYRIHPSDVNNVQLQARLSVIFGSLLYVVGYQVLTSESTSGKAVNITNVLTGHLTIATSLKEVTSIYTIDSNGGISALAVRDGVVLADQVSATTGVEITNGTVRTVNSTTGALGSVIATLPASTKATRVVGDPSSETFYVVAENGYIYRYNLAGTLLASLQLTTDNLPSLSGNDSLVVSSGYVYYGWGNNSFGNVKRINKDLSSFSTFSLASVTGTPGDVSDWVAADYASTKILAAKLLDESGGNTSITPAATPRVNSTLTIELGSSRDGLDSHQKHIITVKRNGYGLRYGMYP